MSSSPTRLRWLLVLLAATLVGALVVCTTPSSNDSDEPDAGRPSPDAIGGSEVTMLRVMRTGNATTDVQNAGDGSGRIFVVEKQGRIRVARFGLDGWVMADAPYLDIRSEIGSDGGERGMLGLAFAPDFATTGRFYVNYTGDDDQTVIARLTADPAADTVDASTLEVLLEVEQPYANHNGGQLRFGPDGMLWIGMGDGGSGGDPQDRAEDTSTLLGKMLRIDVSGPGAYTIPPDNAYANAADGRPEIWAIGLRNPWRFSFDSATGDLWIADVGQVEWEEVNHVPAGQAAGLHFGWNTMEGSHCFSPESGCDEAGKFLPSYEYPHSQGCSVSGGIVARNSGNASIDGSYLLSDFCNDWVRAVTPLPDGSYDVRTLFEATNLSVVAFGQTENGEVLVLDLGGSVYQIL